MEERKKQLTKNRKILISNLPDKINVEDMKQELFYSQNFKISYVSFDGNSAQVTLADNSEATRAAKLINGQLFKGKRISVTFAPLTASSGGLLVVGNLPFDYTEEQFRQLMTPMGEIKRSFLVCNKNTGQSKGYGFVEYVSKDCAAKAKDHFTSTNAKFVNNRIIRVDIASPNVAVGKEQHSKTLFIDHLPKSFDDDEYLRNLFSKTGTVVFCKVAVNPSNGAPRGFAFVDYKTIEETEQSQEYHDGAAIGDSNIRVTFCTPGKTARDIFGKFGDHPTNSRDTPAAPRGRGKPGFHAVVPGMGGLHGPRIPAIMGNSHSMMPMEILPLPGVPVMPLRGAIRGPRPFGPGGPHIPRLLGPETIHPRPRFVVRPNLEGPGPRLRVPSTRSLNLRAVRPKSQGGNSHKKMTKDNTRSSSFKSKVTGSVSSKVKAKETSSSSKDVKPASKEKKMDKASPTVSLSELQKLGESALAAAMEQTPSDNSNVKVLQPVVFMDSEQFQQFQEFQKLMQKQKEVKETGSSTEASLENLIPALGNAQKEKEQKEKEQKEKEQKEKEPEDPKEQFTDNAAVVEQQTVAQKKQEPASQKSAPAPKMHSPVVKETPASQRHSPRTSSQERKPPTEQSPRRETQQQQQQQRVQQQQQQRVQQQQQQRVQQQQRQQQQRQQLQDQRKIKAVGAYEQERKQSTNQESYHGSRQADTNSGAKSTNVPPLQPPPLQPPPLQPPPQLALEPRILQKLIHGAANKRPFDERNDSTAEARSRQEYQEHNRRQLNEQTRSESRPPHDSRYKNTARPITSQSSRLPPKLDQSLVQPGYKQQYQSAEEKDRFSVPKRSPANDRDIMSREQIYSRSRYPETAQRGERNLGDTGHGQTPPPQQRFERERNEEQQQPDKYSRSEIPTRRDRDASLPARDVRSVYDAASRDIRALRDALVSRDLRSLRDIVPSRDALPSRGTNPPRETMPQRERSARDMPQRDSFASRDLRQREVTLPREAIPSRDTLPPRAALLPPRDARSAREPSSYDGDMGPVVHRDVGALRRERDPLPQRYKPTDMAPARVSHEALDRARYERVAAERYEREKDFPRYEREPIESRYPRNGVPWEGAVGASRASHPLHYPINEGPMVKRPRY